MHCSHGGNFLDSTVFFAEASFERHMLSKRGKGQIIADRPSHDRTGHMSVCIRHFLQRHYRFTSSEIPEIMWAVTKSVLLCVRSWCWKCSLHRCHFELAIGPLGAQTDEPAISQITCFQARTDDLVLIWDLCVCGLWHNSTSALQYREQQFLKLCFFKQRPWRITRYPASF